MSKMNNERIRHLKEEHWNLRSDSQGQAEKSVYTHYFGTRQLSWMQSVRDLDLAFEVSPDARERRLWISHQVADSTEDIGRLFADIPCFSGVSSQRSCASTELKFEDNTSANNPIYISTSQVIIDIFTLAYSPTRQSN